jgi:hypothetical protein
MRLKLIDGHLRRDLDPAMEVEVEVLDVSDAEARALLLSIDPLAELAAVREQLRDRLREVAPPVSPELEAAWQAASLTPGPAQPRWGGKELPQGFYVLITCRDEQHQVEIAGAVANRGPQMQGRAVID